MRRGGIVSGHLRRRTSPNQILEPITIDDRTFNTNYNVLDNRNVAQEVWLRGGFELKLAPDLTLQKSQAYAYGAEVPHSSTTSILLVPRSLSASRPSPTTLAALPRAARRAPRVAPHHPPAASPALGRVLARAVPPATRLSAPRPPSKALRRILPPSPCLPRAPPEIFRRILPPSPRLPRAPPELTPPPSTKSSLKLQATPFASCLPVSWLPTSNRTSARSPARALADA